LLGDRALFPGDLRLLLGDAPLVARDLRLFFRLEALLFGFAGLLVGDLLLDDGFLRSRLPRFPPGGRFSPRRESKRTRR